jgi:hypothetical protein
MSYLKQSAPKDHRKQCFGSGFYPADHLKSSMKFARSVSIKTASGNAVIVSKANCF